MRCKDFKHRFNATNCIKIIQVTYFEFFDRSLIQAISFYPEIFYVAVSELRNLTYITEVFDKGIYLNIRSEEDLQKT